MKVKIVIACASGMSTTMLVKKVIEAGAKKGYEVECQAYSYKALGDVVEGAICTLLGPQVGYMADKLRAQFPNMPMVVIPQQEYAKGMMDGTKVFQMALDAAGLE